MPRRTRRRSSALRRRSVWARSQGNTNIGANSMAIDLLDAYRETEGTGGIAGCTVGRIRFQLAYTAASGASMPVVGITRADRTVTNVPNPANQNDQFADWMFWQACPLAGTGSDAAAFCDIDVKSMRKLDEVNQTVYFVAQNVGDGGDLVAYYASSVLLLLP